MNYADETFYKNEYLQGKEAVITTAFDFYARKATKIVNQRTFGNVNTPTIDVKMCTCEIAELIFGYEQVEKTSGGKNSESVSGWSVSYKNDNELKTTLDRRIDTAIKSWLSGTGLLYRGLYNA